MNGINVQFNRSSFGLKPVQVANSVNLSPEGFGEYSIPLTYDVSMRTAGVEPTLAFEAAIQNAVTRSQCRFKFIGNFEGMLSEAGRVPDADFIAAWTKFGTDSSKQVAATLTNLKIFKFEDLRACLQSNNVHFITKRDVNDQQSSCFFSAKTDQGMTLYIEIRLKKDHPAAFVTIKSEVQLAAKWLGGAIKNLLS